jgi:hypothetical protein
MQTRNEPAKADGTRRVAAANSGSAPDGPNHPIAPTAAGPFGQRGKRMRCRLWPRSGDWPNNLRHERQVRDVEPQHGRPRRHDRPRSKLAPRERTQPLDQAPVTAIWDDRLAEGFHLSPSVEARRQERGQMLAPDVIPFTRDGTCLAGATSRTDPLSNGPGIAQERRALLPANFLVHVAVAPWLISPSPRGRERTALIAGCSCRRRVGEVASAP